jgi:CheY-like chemotaxis protein
VHKRRALVVDDSLTARALHRTALEAGGWHVHTASSGEQALEQLRHAAYDVMVVDIGMAPMDGLELTRAVRAGTSASLTPIILVSAHDAPADRARGEAAGADGFLSKRECASGRLLSEVAAVIARRKGAA